MTTLRTLRKLVLGETWALPLAVAVLLGAAVALKAVAPAAWTDVGGPLLAVGVVAVLLGVVGRSAPRR